jgi:hypothetical protein
VDSRFRAGLEPIRLPIWQQRQPFIVMAGLVPAIHEALSKAIPCGGGVDARNKSGHDGFVLLPLRVKACVDGRHILPGQTGACAGITERRVLRTGFKIEVARLYQIAAEQYEAEHGTDIEDSP